jgi:hypothetical protein
MLYGRTHTQIKAEPNTVVNTLLNRTIKTHTPNNQNALYAWPTPLKKPTNYFDLANLTNLLEPIHYSADQQQHAQATIQALSNEINPLSTINFEQLSPLKQEELLRTLDHSRNYIGLVRLYTAIQSLGLANLYTIYNQRVSTTQDTNSPLAREKLRATYRAQDPQWKENLKHADTLALQREQLALMADQLAETHAMRMTLERLLATSSVSLLQVNTLLRTVINEQKNQLLDK